MISGVVKHECEEIGKLQNDYNTLKLKGKPINKEMCDFCDLIISFRDKHCLSNKDALAIAKNEMDMNQIAKVIKEGLGRTIT